jgi:hypothetical protein
MRSESMMTPPRESLALGLVAWGGSALRRWLWWRERRQAARQAVRHAVQTVLGR